MLLRVSVLAAAAGALFAEGASQLHAESNPSECATQFRLNQFDECAIFASGAVPGERPGTIDPENHKVDPKTGKDFYYDVSVPTLQPFLVGGTGNAALIIAPGGGYSLLAMNVEGSDIAEWANSVGMSAFVLKYRVPSRSWLPFGGAPLMDAQRSMGLVRDSADTLGVDPAKIGFAGFSAGGNLAAHISTNYAFRAYNHTDSADEVSARPDFAILAYPWKVVDNDKKTVIMNVTEDTPSSFIVQAEDDPTAPVENSLFYYAALKGVGAAPSELHVYPHGGHGYGRCTYESIQFQAQEICSWPDRAALYLQATGMIPGNSSQLLV